MSREKLIYIASPYAGDIETNTAFAKKACWYAIHQGHTPIAVHLLYPQMLDDAEPTEREIGLRLGHRVLEVCDELWLCGGRVSSGMAVRLRRPNGSASPSDRLGSWKSSRRLCPLRWSKAKLQGRAWVWHNAHAGQPVRWNRRVPTRGGPQRHRAGVGQRDRSLPHRSDKKEVPLHTPCRGHHETEWCRTSPGRHYHRRQPLSGSQRGGGQSRSCRRAFRPVYGADPRCKRNEGCR